MVIVYPTFLRAAIGLVFFTAGGYTLYYAVHPINNIALGIAAILFVIGGLVSDYDDVGKALLKIGETKLTLPK